VSKNWRTSSHYEPSADVGLRAGRPDQRADEEPCEEEEPSGQVAESPQKVVEGVHRATRVATSCHSRPTVRLARTDSDTGGSRLVLSRGWAALLISAGRLSELTPPRKAGHRPSYGPPVTLRTTLLPLSAISNRPAPLVARPSGYASSALVAGPPLPV
jgi:hypothetical protein